MILRDRYTKIPAARSQRVKIATPKLDVCRGEKIEGVKGESIKKSREN